MASSCTTADDNGFKETATVIYETSQLEPVEALSPVTSTSVTAVKAEEIEAYSASVPVNVAGTYSWGPTGWHRDQLWTGVLDVDPQTGCLFMDVTNRDAHDLSSDSTKLHAFLRLSSKTVVNIHGGTVNLTGSETLTDGDTVTVLGTQGWREDWYYPGEDETSFSSNWNLDPQCWANASFWVSWIGSSSADTPQPDPEPAPVAGLLPRDLNQMSHLQEDYCYLQIEGRCLYLQPLKSYRDLKSEETSEIRFIRDGFTTAEQLPDALQRSFLRLHQPEIEFHADSQQLWFKGKGPMTNGDLVIIGGANASGLYRGVDNYIDECHAPWIAAPTGIEPCTTDYHCHPEDYMFYMLSEIPMTAEPSQISSSNKLTTITEDFYVEQYGVTLPQARKRLARIPQLNKLLDEILDIELHRLAGLAIDHYDTFGAWVWLTGNETPHERTTEIAAANPDLEIRLGADHTYFELRDAQDIIFDIAGISGITHEPGGPDWLIHFVAVDMRPHSIEAGIDPGH